MACNNAKYTFLSIGRWCWCCGGGHCCCYWPIANGSNIKCSLSELKAQQKNDSPWPILRREWEWEWTNIEHWTLKIENFKHGPIFRCLTTHHFPGKLWYERCPPVYIYWALKNVQCENFHKTKQKKKCQKKMFQADGISDEVKRLFCCSFLLPYRTFFCRNGEKSIEIM